MGKVVDAEGLLVAVGRPVLAGGKLNTGVADQCTQRRQGAGVPAGQQLIGKAVHARQLVEVER